ncbi:hypothetical protein OIDMADRAFT_52983 [Oidiodendron maius Zn]|uniref:Zn(2)-C6 fungal-type domain-containing protein n=1 Tax=Oidiodendron maius (strain Zn) TaxID=913774 RepID=A0A0C3H4W6_OIDMZ|nr:hypothetical protein OIDMADRAFT_52983 [Oidiodendron maius Zn]
MDPITAIGAVASVVQLAQMALSLSKSLYSLGAAIASASDDIQMLADDLKTFSQSLTLLSRLLEDSKAWYSDDVYLLTAKIIKDCADLYLKIDKVLVKLAGTGKSNWKMRIVFVCKEGQIRKLMKRLRDMKGTLATILMSLQVDLQLSLLKISSSSKIQRSPERPLQHETIQTLSQAQEMAQTSSVSMHTIRSDHILHSLEKGFGVDAELTQVQSSEDVEIRPRATQSDLTTSNTDRPQDDASHTSLQDFSVTLKPPVLHEIASSSARDIEGSSLISRFPTTNFITHQITLPAKGRKASLKSASSSDSFRSAVSVQESPVDVVYQVEAIYNVLHAFRTALQVLESLIESRLQKKEQDSHSIAKGLQDSLTEGEREIREAHDRSCKLHGPLYIQGFTDFHGGLQFQIQLLFKRSAPLSLKDVVAVLHLHSAEHIKIRASDFEDLLACSERCRAKAIFQIVDMATTVRGSQACEPHTEYSLVENSLKNIEELEIPPQERMLTPCTECRRKRRKCNPNKYGPCSNCARGHVACEQVHKGSHSPYGSLSNATEYPEAPEPSTYPCFPDLYYSSLNSVNYNQQSQYSTSPTYYPPTTNGAYLPSQQAPAAAGRQQSYSSYYPPVPTTQANWPPSNTESRDFIEFSSPYDKMSDLPLEPSSLNTGLFQFYESETKPPAEDALHIPTEEFPEDPAPIREGVPAKYPPITNRVSKPKKGLHIHTCDTCNPPKTFSRVEHLRRHQLKHKPPAYQCTVPGCDRVFFRPDLLSRHLQKHQARHERSDKSPAGGSSPTSGGFDLSDSPTPQVEGATAPPSVSGSGMSQNSVVDPTTYGTRVGNIKQLSPIFSGEISSPHRLRSQDGFQKLWWEAYHRLNTSQITAFDILNNTLLQILGTVPFNTSDIDLSITISLLVKKIDAEKSLQESSDLKDVIEHRDNIIRIILTISSQLGLMRPIIGWGGVITFLTIYEDIFVLIDIPNLEISVAEIEEMRNSFHQLEDLVGLLARYAVMENLFYQSPTLTLTDEYQTSLVGLCVTILTYFAHAFMAARIHVKDPRDEKEMAIESSRRRNDFFNEVKDHDKACQGFRVIVEAEGKNYSDIEDVEMEGVSGSDIGGTCQDGIPTSTCRPQ